MDSIPIPSLIYGTAWKTLATEELVLRALVAGYRGIDTANQRKHYREDLVGAGLRRAAAQGIARASLFLQSKYTFVHAHDEHVPYDPRADYATQVRSSFAGTLENLGTEYLDSYLLHGPLRTRGLTDADLQAWKAMEELHRSGKARRIGVCNVSLEQLTALVGAAAVRPAIVQNRCYAKYGWDQDVREYCAEQEMVYEGFSLITANRYVTRAKEVRLIAARFGLTPEQLVLRFAQRIGIVPLTGTKDEGHMRDDLRLDAADIPWDDMRVIAGLPIVE